MKAKINLLLLFITLILTTLGILAVLSASAPLTYLEEVPSYKWALNQIKWFLIGILFLFVTAKIDYHFYHKIHRFLILIVILSLVAVFLPGLGRPVRGVHRWIPLGPFQIQPSEFAKVGTVLYLCCSLVRKREKIGSFIGGFLPYFIILSLIFLLVTVEPDLGSALIIVIAGFVVLYAGGVKLSHILYVILLGILPLYFFIFEVEYRRERIIGFLNPESDPWGIGFQPLHLKMSLGSGGLFGTGPGQGSQKLFYLPTPHTDSIFAVIGEELGFIGTSSILVLFVLFTIVGFKIARRSKDELGKLLALGLTCLISIQALINMGVATVLLPTTGSALPFISYGGSCLLTSFIAVGILLNVSAQATGEKNE